MNGAATAHTACTIGPEASRAHTLGLNKCVVDHLEIPNLWVLTPQSPLYFLNAKLVFPLQTYNVCYINETIALDPSRGNYARRSQRTLDAAL